MREDEGYVGTGFYNCVYSLLYQGHNLEGDDFLRNKGAVTGLARLYPEAAH